MAVCGFSFFHFVFAMHILSIRLNITQKVNSIIKLGGDRMILRTRRSSKRSSFQRRFIESVPRRVADFGGGGEIASQSHRK